MSKQPKLPSPPRNLSTETRRLWSSILRDFPISDAAFLRVLEVSLLALDRAESCRERIAADGLTLTDRFGQEKVHPLLATERDARSSFLQGVRVLNLDPGELAQ